MAATGVTPAAVVVEFLWLGVGLRQDKTSQVGVVAEDAARCRSSW